MEAQDYEQFLDNDEQFIDDSDVESDDDQNDGQVAQVTDLPASVHSYQDSSVGFSCRPKTFRTGVQPVATVTSAEVSRQPQAFMLPTTEEGFQSLEGLPAFENYIKRRLVTEEQHQPKQHVGNRTANHKRKADGKLFNVDDGMQSMCNNNTIKSPSDTMIYVPALKQVQENSPVGRVINTNGEK